MLKKIIFFFKFIKVSFGSEILDLFLAETVVVVVVAMVSFNGFFSRIRSRMRHIQHVLFNNNKKLKIQLFLLVYFVDLMPAWIMAKQPDLN